MVSMREDVLTQVFRAGGIRAVSVALISGRAVVQFVTGEGVAGVVQTKAGHVKSYRVETALRFLAELGVESCTVDLVRMNAGQAALDLDEAVR